MKLELSKWYLRRNGIPVQLVSYRKGSHFPYQDDMGVTYSDTGKYINSSTVDSRDLVREWVPEPDPITSQDPVDTSPQVTTESKPSKHSEAIKAWADGKIIEYKGPDMEEWKEILPVGKSMVVWRDDVQYRVKQVPKLAEVYAVLFKQDDIYGNVSYQLATCISEKTADTVLQGNTSLAKLKIKFNVDTNEFEELLWQEK